MRERKGLKAARGARHMRWAVTLGLTGALILGTSAAWAAGVPEGRRAMGRRGEMQGRRGMGRMGGRGMPGAGMREGPIMPADQPDFDSALAAWNTFYKRSLHATQGEKPEVAKRPLEMSREAWYQVISRYYEEPPAEYAKDPRWQGDLAAITGHLHLGEWLVAAGDMETAHETLEPVRRIWLEIRERNGVRHFGDKLTRFHEVMEPVVLWGTGQTHGGVTDENIEEFYAKVVALDDAWQQVARFGFYPTQQLGPGGQRQYGRFMADAENAVEQLRYTVEDRLLDEIPEAAAAVKQAFVPLYMVFG
jgi:hypothetical protein